ncbi:MAG: TlyA family RNA methyltransferase [Alphaproteobacteria bacterium]|nr:TlyA family RNA methyltransferase [Alphaproteobacteria bacterium]
MLVVEQGLADSRQKAQALVRAGQVLVDDAVVDKPGTMVERSAAVRVRGAGPRFVSRGGEKLDHALTAFGVDPIARVCADLGASTGGFTDCLLQRGAARVFAIDVGYGQLAWKLRQDDRVEVMERTNARHLDALPVAPTLVVGDLSFISLDKVLPAIVRIAAPGADAVLLVKPQFEVGRENVGRGGVVRDEDARRAALSGVGSAAEALGCRVLGETTSPILGAKKGNVEYLVHLALPSPPLPGSPS